MDEIAKNSLLYDFYGSLLTEKQRRIARLYHEEDLSLQEIAEELSISRQGVYDALKKAEQAMADYEEKLGSLKEFLKIQAKKEELQKTFSLLKSGIEAGPATRDKEILSLLSDLEVEIESLNG